MLTEKQKRIIDGMKKQFKGGLIPYNEIVGKSLIALKMLQKNYPHHEINLDEILNYIWKEYPT